MIPDISIFNHIVIIAIVFLMLSFLGRGKYRAK